ncbi:MAG: hypothetical protein BM560_05505 [Roseobacter sp. MedPE-SWde]|nr:MAG: hypothetical protein BM560_05505 [Roseobacter sp. MedPE-SWde]
MRENVIYIAVFSYNFDDIPTEIPSLEEEDILSLGATWRQDLNNGSWATIGVSDPVVEKRDFPNEAFAPSYVGATYSDGGVFSRFLSACFGLIPWNSMADEDCFEAYLNTNNRRPSKLRILDPEARVKYRSDVLGIEAEFL